MYNYKGLDPIKNP